MTLKEKFKEILTAFWINDWEDECEKITDEFAIEFGKWLNNKVINPNGKHNHLLGSVKVDHLLLIFKKEKGLWK